MFTVELRVTDPEGEVTHWLMDLPEDIVALDQKACDPQRFDAWHAGRVAVHVYDLLADEHKA